MLDALAIWRAGVSAVDSERLARDRIHIDSVHDALVVAGHRLPLSEIDHIEVVGGGKAGAGMAAGVEQALGAAGLGRFSVQGWLNVPADCVRPLQRIHLHAARPAGLNEPTAEGVAGAAEILRRVGRLGPRDLCLCLISGGGSALLPAPAEGITLADKQMLTRALASRGANIHELNTVRKALSRIKGGGLLRECRAGTLITLIISDVIGDPLDIIASGPTIPESISPAAALEVLERLELLDIAPRATELLMRQSTASKTSTAGAIPGEHGAHRAPQCWNEVIGNNQVAVEAAGAEAARRGYRVRLEPATRLEGPAEDVGRELARRAEQWTADAAGPVCLVSGGEPTVRLVDPQRRGKGGRNQQLALAALRQWLIDFQAADAWPTLVLLAGGTDGEDGPTDAAGAWVDGEVVRRMETLGFDLATVDDHLARNDAYTFFDQVGGLLRTGPTHTNVCDVRVVLSTSHAKVLP